jgi:O-antigen/teichoic acid export membrane protein
MLSKIVGMQHLVYSGAVRISATLLQFLVLYFAGKYLGSEAIGAIGAIQAFVLSVGVFACGGIPNFVLRRTVGKVDKTKNRVFQRWLSFSYFWVILVSVLTSILVLALDYWYAIFPKIEEVEVYQAGLKFFLIFAVFAYTFMKIQVEIYKGKRAVNKAILLEFIAPNLLVIFLIFVCVFYGFGGSAVAAMGIPTPYISLGSLCFLFHIIEADWQHYISRNIRLLRLFLNELLSLMAVSVGNVFFMTLPIWIAAVSLSLEDAGIMTVSMKLVGVTATLSSIILTYFSSDIASVTRSKDRTEISSLYLKIACLNFVVNGSALFFLILFTERILNLFGGLGGAKYAVTVMYILVASRTVKSMLGTPELFLAMLGKSRYDLYGLAMAVVFFTGYLLLVGTSIINLALAISVASVVRTLASVVCLRSEILMLKS